MHFHTSQVRCNPPGQTITEQLNLFWTWSHCAARQAKLCQALVWTWPWPPQALRWLCTLWPPSAWLLSGAFCFSPWVWGTQKALVVCFPAIPEEDYGCSFHTNLMDSFLVSSICCLTSFPVLWVSNQQLTHGGFFPVQGSEHSIFCQEIVPRGRLPLVVCGWEQPFMPV